MARTIIDLPDPLLREVDSLRLLLGLSRAEAVRRALRDFIDRNHDVKTDGFGLWKNADQTPAETVTPAAGPKA